MERFSASNAAKHMSCPASANLDVAIPGWEEPVIDHTAGAKGKGTNIHKILEDVVNLSVNDMEKISESISYVAALRRTRRFKVLTEVKAEATWLTSKPHTIVDLVLHLQDELHIIDWKTGSIFVDVNNNDQLKYYAACFMHLSPKAEGVWLHIVQPWADNMEKVWLSATELQVFITQAQEAEKKILAKDTTFGPSDHCKFCPANPHSRGDKGRPLCPAMMNLLYPSVTDEQAILALDNE